ncbi:MAG: DUF1566 domain-containing protein [Spirochaetaceae bacterium]|nr:DUF1566 domain-containing protein [Spirochaetaceae bacterium]
MKNTFNFLGIIALVIMGFIITACFNPLQEQEATITINLGGGNARSASAIPWPPQDLPGMFEALEHIITLTGPGPTQTIRLKGVGTARAEVVPGYWTVRVETYLENVETPHSQNGERIHYATGTNSAEVRVGENNSISIQMERAFCNGCSPWIETTAPDCITPGVETRTCSIDSSHNTTRTGAPALGHDWDSWTVTTPAVGPTFVGEETHGCQRPGCTESETRPIFAFSIGDTGPGGGIIFYVADGQGGRPLGFDVQGWGVPNDTGYFSTYTAHYLEAAPANSGTFQWAASGFLIPDLSQSQADQTDWAIGRGRMNTAIIINHGNTHTTTYTTPAASACAALTTGGQTNWFLPSKDELNLLWLNRSAVVDLPNGGYWSSSQGFIGVAWTQFFSNNFSQTAGSKTGTSLVRAIRAF